jgi:2-polyprenyl-3-methyl-5-hydroxy-6-metoxy-1,4-benzoquinol methylase
MTQCHVCHSTQIERVQAPERIVHRVSSDAQPVEGKVAWAVCANCTTIQKVVDDDWRLMAERIYAKYDINHQAGGEEPRLFNTAFGVGPRTQILMKFLLQSFDLPPTGKLLDIGCANGNLLKTAHSVRPCWELFGSEISDQWKNEVLALPGVHDFYIGQKIDYPSRYDLITLSHVLEHVEDPAGFLQPLSRHLTPGGKLVILVPDIRRNPIDLLIADHCSHLDENSLSGILTRAGFEIERLSVDVIPKELAAICGVARPPARRRPEVAFDVAPGALCRNYFRLIDGVLDAAVQAAAGAAQFGVMGSSIAAAWLAAELQERVQFFVDEDASRIGHKLLGRRILGLADIPPQATVFIPMSAPVAQSIIVRAGGLPVRFEYVDWNR